MSAIKNEQISLYCHLNEIIKEPGTSFQTSALSQKDVRNVYHTAFFGKTIEHNIHGPLGPFNCTKF